MEMESTASTGSADYVMFPFIATCSYLVFAHAIVVHPHYNFDEVRF